MYAASIYRYCEIAINVNKNKDLAQAYLINK